MEILSVALGRSRNTAASMLPTAPPRKSMPNASSGRRLAERPRVMFGEVAWKGRGVSVVSLKPWVVEFWMVLML